MVTLSPTIHTIVRFIFLFFILISYFGADPINGEKPKFNYASDGSCGVLKDNEYVPSKLSFPQMEDIKCLKDYYSKIHVTFLDDQLPDYFEWTDKNKDLLLVLVNGCVVCDQQRSKGKTLKVDVRLKWTWPKGSFWSTCNEEEREAENSISEQPLVAVDNARMFPSEKYSNQSYGTSFLVSGTFYQRFCKGFFSTDDLPSSYENVKLVVEHNCGGDGKKFEVKLPDLVIAKYKSHVVEMRGLALDLLKETAKLYNRDESVRNYVAELMWNNWEQEAGQDNSEEILSYF